MAWRQELRRSTSHYGLVLGFRALQYLNIPKFRGNILPPLQSDWIVLDGGWNRKEENILFCFVVWSYIITIFIPKKGWNVWKLEDADHPPPRYLPKNTITLSTNRCEYPKTRFISHRINSNFVPSCEYGNNLSSSCMVEISSTCKRLSAVQEVHSTINQCIFQLIHFVM